MSRPRKYIGLDIGASGIKVSVMTGRGRSCVLEACHFLDTSEEGILNEKEYYALIGEWLQKNGWDNCPTAIAIPQYLVTCTERDFPVCSPDKVPELVDFETRQVSGLSDEAMTYDYVRLPVGLDRINPVLIGIAREQLARERLEIYQNNHIRCDALGIGGMAMVNAFFELYPLARSAKEPVLLLDIGKENSTAVVLAAGQPLFTGSLMFAGDKFAAACNERGPSSLDEIVVDDNTGYSQVMTAARYLEDEIHAALETWRSQENGETGRLVVSKVYLCGGVCRIRGLASWLQEHLETPVELFGPVMDGQLYPEHTVSYGLALQAAGKAAIPLSLLPADVKSRQLRMRFWPLMALALLLVASALGVMEARWYMKMDQISDERLAVLEELESCKVKVEEIKKKRSELYASEASLVPFIAPGNQLGNMMKALTIIGQNTKGRGWLVYLGDDASFEGKTGLRLDSDTASSRNRESDAFLDDEGGRSSSNEASPSSEFVVKLDPRKVVGTNYLVAFCYFLLDSQKPHRYAGEFRELSNGEFFRDVDLLSEEQKERREDIYANWYVFMRKRRYDNYRLHAFKMPLSDKGFDEGVVSDYVEEQMSSKAKGKKKGK